MASTPVFASHRVLTPAERAGAGIPGGAVRLSIGIEDPEDLWADLEQALAKFEIRTAMEKRLAR